MSLTQRMRNGWQIAIISFRLLREHPKLLIFPVLSAASLAVILGTAAGALYSTGFFDSFRSGDEQSPFITYGLVLLVYLVNYFVVIFFNMALIHCARQYFEGEPVDISTGLRFSVSRIRSILSWALFAATVGTILRAIQDNVGFLGKAIVGLVGIVWGISTFLVVPVLAYEKLGPVDALKRSVRLMKERWGEGLSAGFTFGLINLLALAAIIVVAVLAAQLNFFVGIGVAAIGIVALVTVMSAVNSIFVSAVYSGVTGAPNRGFHVALLDDLFERK